MEEEPEEEKEIKMDITVLLVDAITAMIRNQAVRMKSIASIFVGYIFG